MPRAELELPVFLPGNDRDWEKVNGIATITAEGEIHVKLLDPASANMLVQMAQERIPLQISFDYRQSDAALERIYAQHRGTKEKN